jgi:signal transduction histidine kinase
MSPLDINEVIRDVLLLEASSLKRPKIKVHTKLKRNLPAIMATSDQLKQVLINLISNAKDAMPEGGDLNIITESDNNNVLIQVLDTGSGIKKEDQSKIFDAFFTTKKKVKGVGLGLSVSYGIIKRHSGEIEVESEPGAGTKFTIKLPVYKTS